MSTNFEPTERSFSGDMSFDESPTAEYPRQVSQVASMPSVSSISRIGLPHYDFSVFAHQLKTIEKLRSCPETIDLVLTTRDGGSEPVHSYYLALKAPKFWSKIAEQLETESVDQSARNQLVSFRQVGTVESIVLSVAQVEVADIDAPLLHTVISGMYAGKVPLDYDLCWQLLPMAHKFKLDFLTDSCLNYLQGHLSTQNCVQLMQTGLKFGHCLASTAYRYILHHFVKIATNREVLSQLSVHQLSAVLSDNNLQVQNEFLVWRAVINWIEAESQQRVHYFWPLFCLVRWQLMHSTLFDRHILSDFCGLNFRTGDLLADQKVLKNFKYPLNTFNPRVPRQLVFVYGGYEHGLPSSALKVFDIRTGLWFRMDIEESQPRVHHALVRYGRRLLIIGGSDGLQVTNSVVCFNPVTGRFHDRAPMSQARSGHCAVLVGHRILIMGGCNGTERLRSCEAYDPVGNVWHNIAPLNSARSEASAAILNDKVYIAGGTEMFGLSSVELYSFESNSWTIVSFMSVSRLAFSLVAYHNHLYAIGGCTDLAEYKFLRTVERMNCTINQWQLVKPLAKARSSFVSCVLEGKLFVFGGYNGYSARKSAECYNVKTGHWQMTPFLLSTELSGASLDVISDLPNALHYTYYGQCAQSSGSSSSTLPIEANSARKHKQIAQWMVRHSVQSVHKQMDDNSKHSVKGLLQAIKPKHSQSVVSY